MTYHSISKLNHLTAIAIANIEIVYDYFNLEFLKNNTIIRSRCFIHNGDNPGSLQLYYNGDVIAHYKCRTNHCEKHFGISFLSMIRGFLSKLRYKWKKIGNKEATLHETVKFLLEILSQNYDNLTEENVDLEKIKFSNNVKIFENLKTNNKKIITRDSVRRNLLIPSEYYLKRGYTEAVLDKYDVGLCIDKTKQMYQRSVVPIYNEENCYIGCTGRSIFEKCKDCGYYHDPLKNCYPFHKWKHSKGFSKTHCLYNLNNAQNYIKDSNIAIVVESPGNVWRLEEAGIHNSIALLGNIMNIEQKILLDQSGAMTLIILMDNDDGGKKGIEQIKESCQRTYRLYFPTFTANDLGDMTVDKITDDIKPFINNLMESYNEFRI